MRGLSQFCLIVIAILLTVVACQPNNGFLVPPDAEPQISKAEAREITKQFLREFNPGQALVDAADSTRNDIYYRDGESPVVRTSVLPDSIAETIYRYVYFNGYQQKESGLTINNGYMLFIIDGDTVGSGKTEYTISTPEGLEIETPAGQVAMDFSIDDVSSTTDAITEIVQEGDEIKIIVNEEKFSELPPSATASTPEMEGESISKGEIKFTEVSITPEEAVKNLNINVILEEFLSTFTWNYPDGMSEISRELQRDNGCIKIGILLDWYQANDRFIKGKLNVMLIPNDGSAADKWEIVSCRVESDGNLIVSDDKSEGYEISFTGVTGTCNLIATIQTSGDVVFSKEVSGIVIDHTGSFVVNEETITEASIYGNGSVEYPFKVNSGEVLVSLFRDENNYDKSFILTDDINLAGLTWPGSGTSGRFLSFSGTFDGDGHAIKNLTIDQPGQTSFMKIDENGVFKDVKFENVEISIKNGSNLDYLSIFTENHGTISNVSVDEDSTINALDPRGVPYKVNIGGLVGFNGPEGTIENVSNAATIKFYSDSASVGGIAGISAGKIENAINIADIDSGNGDGSYIGGIVGTAMKGATIINARNEGDIYGLLDNTKYVTSGGIAGKIDKYQVSDGSSAQSNDVTISNVINTGNISVDYSAGIVGYIFSSQAGSIKLSAVTNVGDISGDYVAGIIIDAGTQPTLTITGAANNGPLKGTESVAGVLNVCDRESPNATIIAAYSSGEISGEASKYGILCGSGSNLISCYYSFPASREEGYVDGTTITWEKAMENMNSSLSNNDFKFTLNSDGLPSLPEISIQL